MNNNKNRMVLLAALLLPFAVHADDELTLTRLTNMAFGAIDFAGPTGSGNITMGSNGMVVYGNNTSGDGIGTVGQLQIEGPEGTTVTISCNSDANLTLPGVGTIPVTGIGFAVGAANIGSPQSDVACNGITTSVAVHTITATASQNTLFIGGTLQTNNQPLANGTFSSSGGTNPAFRLLVQ